MFPVVNLVGVCACVCVECIYRSLQTPCLIIVCFYSDNINKSANLNSIRTINASHSNVITRFHGFKKRVWVHTSVQRIIFAFLLCGTLPSRNKCKNILELAMVFNGLDNILYKLIRNIKHYKL